MTALLEGIVAELTRSTLLELAAVFLAIAYLVLAVRQNIACWYAAFVSTAIFLYIFWQVNLFMESALQVYYLVMAIYGWWSWQHDHGNETTLPVKTWPWHYHAIAIGSIALATFTSGQMLSDTNQALPYLDSFTTWGAIVTTFMVTRKILENWVYWLVIDAASILLYLDRNLYFTALLFAVYIIIIFFGFNRWLKSYRANQQPSSNQPV